MANPEEAKTDIKGSKGIKSAFNAGASFVRKHESAFVCLTSAFLLDTMNVSPEGIVVGAVAMCTLSYAASVVNRPKKVEAPINSRVCPEQAKRVTKHLIQ